MSPFTVPFNRYPLVTTKCQQFHFLKLLIRLFPSPQHHFSTMVALQGALLGATSSYTAEDRNIKCRDNVRLYVSIDDIPTSVGVAYPDTNVNDGYITLLREL